VVAVANELEQENYHDIDRINARWDITQWYSNQNQLYYHINFIIQQ
jgi:hypothetical protein